MSRCPPTPDALPKKSQSRGAPAFCYMRRVVSRKCIKPIMKMLKKGNRKKKKLWGKTHASSNENCEDVQCFEEVTVHPPIVTKNDQNMEKSEIRNQHEGYICLASRIIKTHHPLRLSPNASRPFHRPLPSHEPSDEYRTACSPICLRKASF